MPTRDREVVERIGEHHYLTTHQVRQFAFTSHDTDESAARSTRRVLQRLERLGLIRRLTRRIGGVRSGSAATTWQLAPAGARLLRADGSGYRTHEPSERFLGHCLAVADTHLAVRDLTGLDHVADVSVQVEPASWRRFAGYGGEPRWLQPDLAAVVTTTGFTDRWFIEVDMGTESLPTLLRKCGQYQDYLQTGIEQAEHDVFPLVVWVLTSSQRAERLHMAIGRAARLTSGMFHVETIEGFRAFATGRLS